MEKQKKLTPIFAKIRETLVKERKNSENEKIEENRKSADPDKPENSAYSAQTRTFDK